MGAGKSKQTAHRPRSAPRRLVATPNKQERLFWFGLICAVLLHAALLLEFARSMPRQMGEPDGDKDAITVDIIDAADFRAKTGEQSRQGAKPNASEDAQQQPAEDPKSASAQPAKQQKKADRSLEEPAPNALAPPPPAQESGS